MGSKWLVLAVLLCLIACKARRVENTQGLIVREGALQEAVSRLESEGFRAPAGSLPLSEQVAESWRYQRERDDGREARFFVVSARAKGDQYQAARLQAESLAKVQLAGLMETRIGQLVTNRMETSGGNSVMQTVASSKNLVTTRISNLYPLLEIYRNLPGGEVEVQLTMACDRRWATEIAWAVISADAVQHSSRSSSCAFTLSGLNTAYQTGEALRFSLTANADCYLHLFVYDAEGVELLFPGEYEERICFRKGEVYTFPQSQWVDYRIEKGKHAAKYEQNVLLVVATLQDIPFTGEASVANVLAWLKRIPEGQRYEQYFSFLSE